MITTRQHWASVIVRNGLWFVLCAGAVATWAAFKFGPLFPAKIGYGRAAFDLSRANALIHVGILPAVLIIVCVILTSNVIMWQVSALEIARGNVSWKLGIVSENRIPLSAIQDLQISRSFGGLLFGYGTLVIRSGFATERLPFIPNVAAIADAIQGNVYSPRT